jgi:hypothetical protein
MQQPPLRVRTQRLLADDRAAGEEQPRDARAFGRDQYFRASGWISVYRRPSISALCHQATPRETSRLIVDTSAVESRDANAFAGHCLCRRIRGDDRGRVTAAEIAQG